MVQDKLFDGWVGSFPVSAGTFGTEEYGTPITFTRGGTITGLRFQRPTTVMETPTRLALWSVSTFGSATLVESIGLASLGTNTGWFEYSLGTPVDVVIGETYLVSLGWNFTHHKAYTTTILPQPWTIYQRLTDLAYASDVARSGTMDLLLYGGERLVLLPIDVVFEPVPYGDFTVSELTDEFQRWLTAGGDKYPDSDLPTIKGQAEGANTNASNAWTTAQEVQTDLGQFRDEWPGTLATALQGGLTTIGDWLSTESDWYKKLVHDTAPGAASLVDKVGDFTGITVFNYLADLIRWANGVNQQPQLADTTDWELLDEIDFTDNLLWPVEADVYRVTLSAFDPAGTSEPVGTEIRHAYLGKWCPFNVQFSSEWHYFNTTSADLYSGGRMPGLGLILYRPGAGHVQAWRRTEAP